MLTLLFFEEDQGPPTAYDDLEHEVASLPDVALDGARGAEYRPGRWRDAATGASFLIDLGTVPIEPDTLHPPTSYPGWRSIPLAVHIPLATPHWHCVEALKTIEALLKRLPQLRAMDSEDNRLDEQSEPGPFEWDRLRVLANWERLHQTQCASQQGLFRMDRVASVALWRYRSERPRGAQKHPDLVWPEALVLLDSSGDSRARSAAAWLDPTRALALPPVEFLVIQRNGEAGAVPSDELLTAAGGGVAIDLGQATRIEAGTRVQDFFHRAKLLPVGRFKFLGDSEWAD